MMFAPFAAFVVTSASLTRFQRFVPLVAPVVGFSAVVAVAFDGFLQPVLRVMDSAIAIVPIGGFRIRETRKK
jgi:hypothetical protein